MKLANTPGIVPHPTKHLTKSHILRFLRTVPRSAIFYRSVNTFLFALFFFLTTGHAGSHFPHQQFRRMNQFFFGVVSRFLCNIETKTVPFSFLEEEWKWHAIRRDWELRIHQSVQSLFTGARLKIDGTMRVQRSTLVCDLWRPTSTKKWHHTNKKFCPLPCCFLILRVVLYKKGLISTKIFPIDFSQTNVKPDLHRVRHSAKTLCASFQLQIALHFLWALRKTINQTSISGTVRLSLVSTMAGRQAGRLAGKRCSAHTACHHVIWEL